MKGLPARSGSITQDLKRIDKKEKEVNIGSSFILVVIQCYAIVHQMIKMWHIISIVFYVIMVLFVLFSICWAVRLCHTELCKMNNSSIPDVEAVSQIRMYSVNEVYEI